MGFKNCYTKPSNYLKKILGMKMMHRAHNDASIHYSCFLVRLKLRPTLSAYLTYVLSVKLI